ncbi:AzlC family ABC transporter permease [Ramlibacter sp.]|uniref:AzlC family ABC transporter permease n=1 Tax=Ramlibacter sp. TaxID=1917967 RepID=UPI001822710A|nr:AzlC family ABC transporter permease [Ramlibacter sp.]MBA2675334.1 AzlC family ABC transporter permease [Ramlibacter sp.]
MSAAPVSFARAGVWRGFVHAQPLAPGVALYGLVFGVLAGERGLGWAQAVLMSTLVYSGSAQLAALQVWSSTPAIAAVLLTVAAINARYLLYGAALQPWLVQVRGPRAWASLFLLGDGRWVLAMRKYEKGERDAGYVLGTGFAGVLPWVGGTLVGHLLTRDMPDPRGWGLDFMLPAFAAAIGISVWRGRADWLPLLAALGAAMAVHKLVPGG